MPRQADQVLVDRAVEQAEFLLLRADRRIAVAQAIEIALQELVGVIVAHENLGGFVAVKRDERRPREDVGGEDQQEKAVKERTED